MYGNIMKCPASQNDEVASNFDLPHIMHAGATQSAFTDYITRSIRVFGRTDKDDILNFRVFD